MNDYIKNESAVLRWIIFLNIILKLQKKGMYDVIKKDYQFNRLIEVLEEYDDIIFEENK